MDVNQPMMRYAVDVVFVIDTTGSMHPYLDSVKAAASDFHGRLEKAMESQAKGITQLRLRVVSYRDLGHDGPDAITGTPFFKLPDDSASFTSAVNGLIPDGGGDEPESALEALALAFRSDWERSLDKRRHVVVVCTDASSHPLGKFSMTPASEQSRPMPTSMEELQAIWGDAEDDGEMEYAAKRLIVFGPNKYPWDGISGLFENCVWVESTAGHGMRDQDMDAVLDAIAGSV